MTLPLEEKINNYKTPEKAIDLVKSTRLVFLVGVTGAGKDTIIKELMSRGGYHYVVSHTTREPRKNNGISEKDGESYHFIDRAQAISMLDNHTFIEAKEFSGNLYGTSITEIQTAHDQDKIAITEIEVQGVAEYHRISDNVMPIFILPPDFDTWQKRIKERYGDNIDKHDLAKRLATAARELQEALDKDYFVFVINDDLAETVQAVDNMANGRIPDLKNEEAKKLARSLLLSLQKTDRVE